MDYKSRQLSMSEINEILRKKLKTENFEILSISMKPMDIRIGLLGDHYSLQIQASDKDKVPNVVKNVTAFVKFMPALKETAEFVTRIGAFTKEVFAYNLFEQFEANNIKYKENCVPKYYLSIENQYIVLDDLLQEKFTTLNNTEILDYDSVKLIIQSLAKFHGCSLIFEELKSTKGSKFRLGDFYKNEFEESFFSNKAGYVNIRGIEASIKGIMTEIDIFEYPEHLPSSRKFKDVANEICHKIYDMVKPSSKFRNVLCHGDLWATNYLLKYDNDQKPIQCKFVDFQCSRYTPPSRDLLSFIYLNTTREFRKEHMYYLIGDYYAYLEKVVPHLQDLCSIDEFLYSVEESRTFAIIQTAIYFPLILLNNNFIEECVKDPEMFDKCLGGDRSSLILANKDKDEIYMNRLRESIEDLWECCKSIDSLNAVECKKPAPIPTVDCY